MILKSRPVKENNSLIVLGLRITITCLLEILMVGVHWWKVGVELLVNLMNSNRIREVIEWVAEEMMWLMESEVDKK